VAYNEEAVAESSPVFWECPPSVALPHKANITMNIMTYQRFPCVVGGHLKTSLFTLGLSNVSEWALTYS
jgi:hypothetical protein